MIIYFCASIAKGRVTLEVALLEGRLERTQGGEFHTSRNIAIYKYVPPVQYKYFDGMITWQRYDDVIIL